MQAGYSLPEAIRCATHNGAQLPRIENAFRLIAKAGRQVVSYPEPSPFHIQENWPALKRIMHRQS